MIKYMSNNQKHTQEKVRVLNDFITVTESLKINSHFTIIGIIQ